MMIQPKDAIRLACCEHGISLSPEADCPVSTAHVRLSEFHLLWHQAAASYDNPPLFHANLNAALQASRNVTFALQADKAKVPDFDTWYAAWQARFGKDRVMLWLRDARNQVVKQTDLTTASRARACILLSWTDELVREFDTDPAMSNADLLAQLVREDASQMPAFMRQEAVLCVEREWVAESFPDCELLSVLEGGFRSLHALLREAHERCGRTMTEYTRPGDGSLRPAVPHPSGRLVCMAPGRAFDSYVKLKSGDAIAVTPQPIVDDAMETAEKAARRYKLKDGKPDRAAPEDPLAFGGNMMWIAKKMLVRDRRLHTVVMLRTPNGLYMNALEFADQAEKYVAMRHVAADVERLGAFAVILVGEVWTLPVDKFRGIRPTDSPEREEAICVEMATVEGGSRMWTAPFKRGLLGGIKFDETGIADENSNTFLPIRRVWRRWDKERTAREAPPSADQSAT